jgi:butyryl-CoA dehydrogenase
MSCASTAISVSIHGTTCSGLEKFGSDSQKEEYLGRMIAGELLGAFTLTEPHSGSDAGAIETKASREGNGYVLNGSKIFISNGGIADVYFVFARTAAGPSAFLVPKGSPGLRFGKNVPKLGIRGSTLAEVFFEDCRVPASDLVGTEGMGFEYAKQMLHGGRVTIAALSVGIAQMALEKSVEYSKGRVTFGAPLSQRQMIRQKLADMATSISAARALTYHAAWLRQEGVDYTMEAAEAKLFASEMSLRVCDDAIQIHGGYGYTDDLDVHRHWRDARLMTIGEGTSEVMRLVVSKGLLQGDG